MTKNPGLSAKAWSLTSLQVSKMQVIQARDYFIHFLTQLFLTQLFKNSQIYRGAKETGLREEFEVESLLGEFMLLRERENINVKLHRKCLLTNGFQEVITQCYESYHFFTAESPCPTLLITCICLHFLCKTIKGVAFSSKYLLKIIKLQSFEKIFDGNLHIWGISDSKV